MCCCVVWNENQSLFVGGNVGNKHFLREKNEYFSLAECVCMFGIDRRVNKLAHDDL